MGGDGGKVQWLHHRAEFEGWWSGEGHQELPDQPRAGVSDQPVPTEDLCSGPGRLKAADGSRSRLILKMWIRVFNEKLSGTFICFVIYLIVIYSSGSHHCDSENHFATTHLVSAHPTQGPGPTWGTLCSF